MDRPVAAFALACSLAISFVAAGAMADDRQPDTVHLTNGGLLRGIVMEEDPKKGVAIVLLDGTTRKIPANQVGSVKYAADAPAVAASPPAAAQVQPAAVPMPAVAAAPPPAPPSYGLAALPIDSSSALATQPKTKSLRALWVPGLIGFLTVYVVGIPLTAAVAYGEHGEQPGRSVAFACIPLVGPWIGLANPVPGETGGQQAAIVTSGVLQSLSAAMFFTGIAIRVPDRSGSARLTLAPTAMGGKTNGLSLAGTF